MIEIREDAEIGSVVVEILAPLDRDPLVTPCNVVEFTQPQPDIETFKILLQDVIDHAGNRIGAVNSRRAVAQDFNALQTKYRQAL